MHHCVAKNITADLMHWFPAVTKVMLGGDWMGDELV